MARYLSSFIWTFIIGQVALMSYFWWSASIQEVLLLGILALLPWFRFVVKSFILNRKNILQHSQGDSMVPKEEINETIKLSNNRKSQSSSVKKISCLNCESLNALNAKLCFVCGTDLNIEVI